MTRVFAKRLAKKKVMSSDGTELGIAENVVIDPKSGTLIDLVVRPDANLDTSNFKEEAGYILIPFDAVRAVKDYAIVDKSLSMSQGVEE